MTVLVTGATGTLGRHLLPAALAADHTVRALSRSPSPDGPAEWLRADLTTGDGLAEAFRGVDAVVHAATDPRQPEAVDVAGTRRVVQAAQAAGVGHVVYVSIVGVDRVPLGYYRAKAEAERIVEASGVAATVLRAAQFHAFVDALLAGAARVPFVLPVPRGVRLQPVAAAEVAARVVRALADGPGGRVSDLAGPAVHPIETLADAWKAARGVSKPTVGLPVPGGVVRALRDGATTAPDGDRGRVSWETYLREAAPPAP